MHTLNNFDQVTGWQWVAIIAVVILVAGARYLYLKSSGGNED
jgi:hypothetical protein